MLGRREQRIGARRVARPQADVAVADHDHCLAEGAGHVPGGSVKHLVVVAGHLAQGIGQVLDQVGGIGIDRQRLLQGGDHVLVAQPLRQGPADELHARVARRTADRADE
jgi:hypothetical protein